MPGPSQRLIPAALTVAVAATVFTGIKSCNSYYDNKNKQAIIDKDLPRIRKARTQLDSLTELYGSTPRRDLSTVVIPELIKLRDQIDELATTETPACLSSASTSLKQATEKTLESVKAFADISYDFSTIEISAMLAEKRSSLYLQEARSLKAKVDEILERHKSLRSDKFLAYCYGAKSK